MRRPLGRTRPGLVAPTCTGSGIRRSSTASSSSPSSQACVTTWSRRRCSCASLISFGRGDDGSGRRGFPALAGASRAAGDLQLMGPVLAFGAWLASETGRDADMRSLLDELLALPDGAVRRLPTTSRGRLAGCGSRRAARGCIRSQRRRDAARQPRESSTDGSRRRSLCSARPVSPVRRRTPGYASPGGGPRAARTRSRGSVRPSRSTAACRCDAASARDRGAAGYPPQRLNETTSPAKSAMPPPVTARTSKPSRCSSDAAIAARGPLSQTVTTGRSRCSAPPPILRSSR